MFTHSNRGDRNQAINKLVKQINDCFFAINQFDPMRDDVAELLHEYNKLQSFQHNFHYRYVSQALKKSVSEQIYYTSERLFSLGVNIPQIPFFEEPESAIKLTNQINACIVAIDTFNFQMGDLAQLRLLYDKLGSYQDNVYYCRIHSDLIQTVNERKNYIADYLSFLEVSIQIPSNEDIFSMKGMSAGDKEDQRERLGNMVRVCKDNSYIPVYTTQDTNLPSDWLNLFNCINQGDYSLAESTFQQIHRYDWVLEPLLSVHPKSYLLELIRYSIDAQSKSNKRVKLNDDLIVTPRTFEILIRDLASTLTNQSTINFSFGLPTHHAFSHEGSGFCFINKPAVLMNYLQLQRKNEAFPLQYIIVGTDVNRDNGLCAILREEQNRPFTARKFACHIDLFDSRVYPNQTQAQIKKEFNPLPLAKEEAIQYIYHRDYEYHAVDLSLTSKANNDVHPAIVFALQTMQKSIEDAIFYGRKIVLIFTAGWDAHLEETACCGKYVDNKWMSKSEAQKTRFSDSDFQHFYTEVMALYMANKEHIKKFYWGLEGGYDRAMYENQIELMLDTVNNALHPAVSPALK